MDETKQKRVYYGSIIKQSTCKCKEKTLSGQFFFEEMKHKMTDFIERYRIAGALQGESLPMSTGVTKVVTQSRPAEIRRTNESNQFCLKICCF